MTTHSGALVLSVNQHKGPTMNAKNAILSLVAVAFLSSFAAAQHKGPISFKPAAPKAPVSFKPAGAHKGPISFKPQATKSPVTFKAPKGIHKGPISFKAPKGFHSGQTFKPAKGAAAPKGGFQFKPATK